MVVHETVGVFGLGFDVGGREIILAILQQTERRLLLRPSTPQTGRVLIPTVCLTFTGGQCDLKFPIGRILDGADREIEIGFDSNVHCFYDLR